MVIIQRLNELLDYDPITGIFTWKPLPRQAFDSEREWRKRNSRYAGKRAGSIHKRNGVIKKRVINIDGKLRAEHRLAWLLMTGNTPPGDIDHINRDPTDNRWRNLRDGTDINNRNRGRFRNNKSGVAGVHWAKNTQKWRATVSANGRNRHLGDFRQLADAAAAVGKARAQLGYSPAHGNAVDGITNPTLPSAKPRVVVRQGANDASD